MSELADQIESGEVVSDAPIPEAPVDHGIETNPAPAEAATPDGKPKKLSIRESLNQAVEQARADEKGRLHGKDGKFASKTPVEAQGAPAEIPQTEKDVQPDKPSTAIGPPPGWSAASKAVFATLPDPVKQDILKREKEVSDGFKQKSEELKRFQEIEQVLAPSRSVYQQQGVKSDAEAIKALFAWEASFRNPATRMQSFHNLARQYGINLNSPQSQAPDAQGIPDQLRPVLDQFGQLSHSVASIQDELQRSREEQIGQTIASFSKDKPYFEKVRVQMGILMMPPTDRNGNIIGSPAASSIEDAYQKAIWADPEIRPLLMKEQFEKQQSELRTNQTQRSQAARQAAISPSSRSPTAPVVNGAKPGKMSVRETIKASVRELQDQRA